MLTEQATLYRGLLRELRQSVTPRKVNRGIMANFRSIAERIHGGAANPKDAKAQQGIVHAKQDYDNAILFLRSQREHARLLERYNPTFDLTSQDRIQATARRVGLNMPKMYDPTKDAVEEEEK
ncbi:hypothetical protein D9619_000371 [Psilocybe cf. subviscida]|uniref:Uncharacterized protein n=1 Tax=Psilocybe cf. subviscida TaxID=2480587 RepID=A0A8H5BHZ3_9AGAR|nr:hypothetical protein D9619_000371 [Psilocybe cf. subviscida]